MIAKVSITTHVTYAPSQTWVQKQSHVGTISDKTTRHQTTPHAYARGAPIATQSQKMNMYAQLESTTTTKEVVRSNSVVIVMLGRLTQYQGRHRVNSNARREHTATQLGKWHKT